jgi:hypothetical protein
MLANPPLRLPAGRRFGSSACSTGRCSSLSPCNLGNLAAMASFPTAPVPHIERIHGRHSTQGHRRSVAGTPRAADSCSRRRLPAIAITYSPPRRATADTAETAWSDLATAPLRASMLPRLWQPQSLGRALLGRTDEGSAGAVCGGGGRR